MKNKKKNDCDSKHNWTPINITSIAVCVMCFRASEWFVFVQVILTFNTSLFETKTKALHIVLHYCTTDSFAAVTSELEEFLRVVGAERRTISFVTCTGTLCRPWVRG